METNKAKISVRFYLEKSKNLICTFSYDNKRTRVYIKESLEPKFWNKKQKKLINTIENLDYDRLNKKFNDIENKFTDLFHKFIKEYDRKPEHQELKEIFLKEYFDEKPQFSTKKRKTLLDTFDEYIELKKIENIEQTAKQYENVKNKLVEFGKIYKQQIQFENINMEFRNKYISYLQNDLELQPTTIHRHMKYFKTILHYALDMNYVSKLNIYLKNFNTKDIEPIKIALTEYELNELENLDLSNNKRLDEVRDRFLIGCYTGLRFSDFIRLNKNHISDDDYIQIEQKKVKKQNTLPFTDEVKKIFKKYNYNLPKPITEQRFNLYLKELTALCDSFHRLQEITTYKGSKSIKKDVPRYTLVTTHTARRTFVTINSAKGIDAEVLRYATGHTTTKQLKQYIKLDDKQKADLLKREFDRVKQGQPKKETKRIAL